MTAPWQVLRLVGSAAELHDRELPSPPLRQLWLCQVTRPALVLGSSARQQEFVNRELAHERGVEVLHRRSGGAAVLLEPGAQLWADLLIGKDDPLWQDDVGRAAWWVGAWWQRSLARLGIATTVHQGPLRGGEAARRICFAGVGPGEVLADGRKLVGLSQRRTRTVARLQTVMLVQWQPAALAAMCNWPPPQAVGTGSEPPEVAVELGGAAVGLGELLAERSPGSLGPATAVQHGLLGRLEAALIEELPRS